MISKKEWATNSKVVNLCIRIHNDYITADYAKIVDMLWETYYNFSKWMYENVETTITESDYFDNLVFNRMQQNIRALLTITDVVYMTSEHMACYRPFQKYIEHIQM